ncbi:prepilin peptidase [bacterium]|nr:prepilin peptidase [bacterium]MBU1614045.1 prepilin peptidase [bacterium]
MEILASFVIFVLGISFGSFLNVCIYRIPEGKSIVSPRSFCPNCKTPIPFSSNIPILSYLLLKGRCRSCGQKISPRYLTVELLTGLLYLSCYYQFGLSSDLPIYLFFSSVLIVITFIDFEHQLILNKITYPVIISGFLISLLPGGIPFYDSILGFLIGGGFIYSMVVISPLIFGQEGMGGGDVKLAALIGVFLGWQNILLTLILASLSGGLMGVTLILLKLKKRRDYIPFGPYLCLGALVALFFGEKIIGWYLGQL